MLNPLSEDVLLPSRRWEMISEQTLAAIASTIDFPGLDMNQHRHYRLYFEITNAHIAAIFIGLYFNNDLVHANYRHNDFWARGAATGGLNNNQPRASTIDLGEQCSMVHDIVQYYGGRVGYVGHGFTGLGATFELNWFAGHWLTIPANVTQITLRSLDFANVLQLGMAAGSRARLFRLYEGV
jgi:hypothetical protein